MKFSPMQRPIPNLQPSWSRMRMVLISLLLLLLAVSSLAWRQPPETRSVLQSAPTAIPTHVASEPTQPGPTQASPTAKEPGARRPTLLPSEYLTNSQQTTGIIFVASIMVLIVVSGVLYTLLTEKHPPE